MTADRPRAEASIALALPRRPHRVRIFMPDGGVLEWARLASIRSALGECALLKYRGLHARVDYVEAT